MKLLLETWQEYLGPPDEPILNEINKYEYEYISQGLEDLKPEQIPFNEEFGGRMRFALPYGDGGGKLDIIKQFFGYLNMKIDWKKGVVYLPGEQKRFIKIGRLLGKLETLQVEFHNGLERVLTKTLSDEDINKIVNKRDTFKRLAKKDDVEINKFNLRGVTAFWNKNAQFYKEHPEEAEKEQQHTHYMIFTRHPIDIFRMSDFDNIYSCHSPISRDDDAGFFKCAIAEAKVHAPVVYLVEKDELEKTIGAPENLSDYDDKEIFYDKLRHGQAGEISPVARIRLRKFIYENEQVPLMASEDRMYGKAAQVFKQKVLEWAQQSQKEKIEAIKKEQGPTIKTSYFKLVGGTYTDTSPTLSIANLFDISVKDIKGNVLHLERDPSEDEAEDGMRQILLGPRKEARKLAQEISNKFLPFKNFEFNIMATNIMNRFYAYPSAIFSWETKFNSNIRTIAAIKESCVVEDILSEFECDATVKYMSSRSLDASLIIGLSEEPSYSSAFPLDEEVGHEDLEKHLARIKRVDERIPEIMKAVEKGIEEVITDGEK